MILLPESQNGTVRNGDRVAIRLSNLTGPADLVRDQVNSFAKSIHSHQLRDASWSIHGTDAIVRATVYRNPLPLIAIAFSIAGTAATLFGIHVGVETAVDNVTGGESGAGAFGLLGLLSIPLIGFLLWKR